MASPGTSTTVAYPCLVRDDEEQTHTTFSLPQRKLHHHVSVVPAVPGDDTCFLVTPQGWILIVDRSQGSAFLLQPQTSSKVELPPLGDIEFPERCRCLLSGNDGSAPGCGVLVLYVAADNNPSLLFCRVGGRRWSNHGYDIGCYNLPSEYCPVPQKRSIFNIASVGGRFFFFDSDTNSEIGTLDFTDNDGPEPPEARLGTVPVARLNVFGDSAGERSAVAMRHLLESRGDLYLVTVVFYAPYDFSKPGTVGVYKMDFSASAWQRIEDIGDCALLCCSPNFGASCSANKYSLKPNRLYWANCFKQDQQLHVYDLRDGNLEEVIDMFDQTSGTPKKPCWIVPTAN